MSQPPAPRNWPRLVARTAVVLAGLAIGAYLIGRWREQLFGPGTWGTGGNLIAWVLCGFLAGIWVKGKLAAHQAAVMAQAARQHRERAAQAEEQHRAQIALAEKHHQEMLDRADVHHEALKAHVTTVASQDAPKAVLKARAPAKGTTG